MFLLRRARFFAQLLLGIATLVISLDAAAIPLFARQTGFQCAACHTTFPELTPLGRKFKLLGYTMGTRQDVPLAAMALVSVNRISSNKDNATGDSLYGKNNAAVFEGGSVFTGGKFSDHLGAFVQWTYSNLDTTDDQQFRGHSSLDNADVRYGDTFSVADQSVIGGLTVHNNPSVQDVWNTAPAWVFPYMSPSVASPGTGPASTFVESGAKVAGIGAYALINDSVYVEATAYRKAKGVFSILKAGSVEGDVADLKGLSPYWRVAYNFDEGNHHFMLGHFGVIAKQNAAPGESEGDRFRDIGFDSQYQYFGENDQHIVTAMASYVDEKADWHSGFATGANDNATSRLRSTKFKVTYLYDHQYAINASSFRLSGDTDVARFANASGRPDTSGYVLELDYLPKLDFAFDRQLTARIGLQYTAYSKFNGASSNYDDTLRKASDNNTTYLYLWSAF